MIYGQSIYGNLGYSQEDIEGIDIAIYAPNLMEYLPQYYQKSAFIKALQNAKAKELGLLKYRTQNILEQFLIQTATWGLDLWEEEYGLRVDLSKPYIYRREIISAKIRGSGTTSKQMIENMAMAFSGGEAKVNEFPSEYRFEVQFIGIKGIPQNMAGLIDAIEDIKPAHLAYSFMYTYTVWNNVNNLTWSEVSNKTWSELRTYEEG